MTERYEFSISIPKDSDGFIGRECPNPKCESYFKIKPGTGLVGKDLDVHCPYCGYVGKSSEFATSDQIEYAKSLAIREIQRSIGNKLQEWGQNLERSTRGGFLSFKFEYKENPQPIQFYREKKLETVTKCSNCELKYSIFGLFAFCPDCGIHNSIQIFNQNMGLAMKEIAFSKDLDDPELSDRLVEEALQSTISAFDGFGRIICISLKHKAKNPDKIENISFQNIIRARADVQNQFNYDFASEIDSNSWNFITICFQKRHLLAHKFGIVDQEYLLKTNDKSIVIGKRIHITPDEANKFINFLQLIGNNISLNLK